MAKLNRAFPILMSALAAGALLAGTAFAVPQGFNVQGRLTDSNGVNRNGTYSIKFSIWNRLEGGDPAADKLWEASLDNLSVRNGNFQVVLGAQGQPALGNAFNGDATYLEMTVLSGPDVTTPEPPLVPRMQLVSVPYAMRAGVADQVLLSGVPPGTVQMYAAETPPSGYLECDGEAYSADQYPSLYSAIGTAFGNGSVDKSGQPTSGKHFNLPDLRGAFVRGWNHGQGKDPEALNRSASSPGGVTGDRVGSYQADGIKAHQHQYTEEARNYGSGGGGSGNPGTAFTNTTTGGPTAAETRPKNVNVMFIIKI